jgi:phage terminase large subunit
VTSTPNGFNSFYNLTQKAQRDDDWFYSHATSYDNPYNDAGELERLKKTKSEDAFAQEYLADFRKLEGLVYKDFDRNRHLFDDFTRRPPTVFVYAGIDFGWTNPTAIIKIEQDADSHFWVTREWFKREADMHTIAEQCRQMGAAAYYPDPAEPDRINELKRGGMNVHEVSKDVEAGIASVQALIRQNRLHIHQDCKHLINELETYRYEEAKPDKNLPEKPVKENDHGLDALRYVIHMVVHNVPTYDEVPLAVY